jgi:hypothetical protein
LLPIGLIAAAALLLGACAKADPLSRTLDASSPLSLTMWRSNANDFLSAEQQADLDLSLQQIRFAIMGEGRVSGSEAIEAELLQRVDGMSVRAVLKLGLGADLAREVAERDATRAFIQRNATVRTAAGDLASQDYLEHFRETQERRLKAAEDEIARVSARLAADGITPP